jgi:tRNA (guanine-N7-)-methyltransferase
MGRTKTSSLGLSSESEWKPYWLQPTERLNWIELFGNENAVEVEVGSGKGLFLVSAALRVPGRNFLGIEVSRKFAVFTANRLAQHSLRNARVAQADARRVLAEWIAPASIAAVHIYFPDPWWKRRHRKRRIVTDSLVSHIAHALVPGGELRVASDVEQYFGEIQETIAAHGQFHPLEMPVPHDAEHDVDYLSNFERKYRRAGKPIWRANYRLSLRP